MSAQPDVASPRGRLHRALGLPEAIALNVANMIGIGPFITIPLFMATMGGPHAMIAWLLAAVLVMCDGLVWSELGAALPGSGGTYHFLKEIYGPLHPLWGQLMPFLFIWQFLISGPLEMASGYVGTIPYLRYALPGLEPMLLDWGVPGGANTVAAAGALVVTAALCRRIEVLSWFSIALCAGTMVCVLTVIVSGLGHFDAAAFTFPAAELSKRETWTTGLGAAMHIAVYDYLGYYNICNLGDEVRNPSKTIPRAVIGSVVIVAAIYALMNVAFISVIPWQEAMNSGRIAADFMERLYGRQVSIAFTWLVVWAALAGLFAMALGYSRIPYAAACGGDFFSAFGRLAKRGYPVVSLWALGILTAACCYLSLDVVIEAAITVRILVQFMGQIAAVHVVRTTRPDIALPFRMRLYPLASLVALLGWTYLLATSTWVVLATAFGVTAVGVPAFLVWRLRSVGRR